MYASLVMAVSPKSWRLTLWMVSIALGISASVMADEEAVAWLEGMTNAARELSYHGTFVYQQGNQSQTLQIIHAVTEQGEFERLVAISGQTREVIRSGDKVTCILPENSSIVVEQANTPRPFQSIPLERLAQLQQYYRIELGRRERIAGRFAQEVAILPKDVYRYGQRLWLDEQTRLPLQSAVLDEEGRVLEKLFFTSLEVVNQIAPEMLQPAVGQHDQVLELERQPPQRLVTHSPHAAWQAADIPPGFALKIRRRHFLPNKFNQVEHHVYSDGLASISVFIEPEHEAEGVQAGVSRIGGVNVFALSHAGHFITALGEVPEITVRQVAQAMREVSAP